MMSIREELLVELCQEIRVYVLMLKSARRGY
jgi:hypothetical protein